MIDWCMSLFFGWLKEVLYIWLIIRILEVSNCRQCLTPFPYDTFISCVHHNPATISPQNNQAHEEALAEYLWDKLGDPSLNLQRYGPSPEALRASSQGGHRSALVAFTHPEAHASDLAFFLDQVSASMCLGVVRE